MSDRHLPVRPNLDQLRHQAKDLLRSAVEGDRAVAEEFERNHPDPSHRAAWKLSDAQLALARSYGVRSWPRLVQACRVIDAIWRDDGGALDRLIQEHPYLLHEMARGTETCNWGPPMSYAANLGRDRIIDMLHERGARDVTRAMDRAVLQGRINTARKLFRMGGRPARGAVMGPAETQNGDGMAYLVELGAEISDEQGERLAPVALLLETYGRNPAGKHRCLELFARHGVDLPDTPVMALHRGRLDLLGAHLENDPSLLTRTFSHDEIYPPSLGCHRDTSLALTGTPIGRTTLLHMSVEYGELDIAGWLLERGMDANVKAAVDVDGFGGHTPLFACVVRIPGLSTEPLARCLLDHGANPEVRASLRKRLLGAADESLHEYRNVNPHEWGLKFHDPAFVDAGAMRAIAQASGR